LALDGHHITRTGETSAHVHVGLPDGFSPYDLLAISTLVDEKAVKSTAGPERNLQSWAALRDAFISKVSGKLEAMIKEKNVTGIKISSEKLKVIVKELSHKFTGTNISAYFNHKTVEFRYLGSNIKNVDTLLKWVDYFMLLPKVAMTRNRIKLGNVYLNRGKDGMVSVTLSSKQSEYPATDDDKTQQSYLDKLRDKKRQLTTR
jgi:hypothetical protein